MCWILHNTRECFLRITRYTANAKRRAIAPPCGQSGWRVTFAGYLPNVSEASRPCRSSVGPTGDGPDRDHALHHPPGGRVPPARGQRDRQAGETPPSHQCALGCCWRRAFLRRLQSLFGCELSYFIAMLFFPAW